MSSNRIALKRHSDRGGFAIVFDELWSDYLAHIGGHGALLYCFLKYLSGREIPNPCSKEWGQEVCEPLGLSVLESHHAWAKLQEMGLIAPIDSGYVLRDPAPRALDRKEQENNTLLVEVEKLFGRPLSMTEINQVEELEHIYGAKLLLAAVGVSVEAQALSMPYIKQVLVNWKAKGITSVEQAAADIEDFRLRKARKHARKGERQAEVVDVQPGAVNYDASEVILRRIRKSAGEEVVNRGW